MKKKKVLILGASGMLGHKLCQIYHDRFDTWGTVRANPAKYSGYNLLPEDKLLGGVDALVFESVITALAQVQPNVVINCVGIIKQLEEASDPIISLKINALWPHLLGNLCQATHCRLIHISTDCVFSGSRGMYTEEDISDAEDLYGRTKYLGEVTAPNCLTLRTSIIGRELQGKSGLLEWFLGQNGQTVRGYRQAIYSGFTTHALACIMATLIEDYPEMTGLYQLSSDPIDKYHLLQLIKEEYGLSIKIDPDDQIKIDRSLNSKRFWEYINATPPTWSKMVANMAADTTPYEDWRES